jgi:hypothetical protein
MPARGSTNRSVGCATISVPASAARRLDGSTARRQIRSCRRDVSVFNVQILKRSTELAVW